VTGRPRYDSVTVLARLKPYWLQIYLLTYTPLLLLADSKITALWQQWLLGAHSFAALYLAALRAPREQRVQIWTCVVVATGFEIFGSLIWGSISTGCTTCLYSCHPATAPCTCSACWPPGLRS